MKRRISLFILLNLLLLGVAAPTWAADKKDKSAKRAAIMMQKLKADLEVEKSNMQAQFDQEKKVIQEKLVKIQGSQRAHDAQIGTQKKLNQLLISEKEKLLEEKKVREQTLAELQHKIAEMQQLNDEMKVQLASEASALTVNEAQRSTLLAKVAQSHHALLECQDKNQNLARYGHELVALYADAGRYQKAMRNETFFQLKRVELENILQEKHDLINESSLQP